MKKGERIEISIAVLAKESDMSDREAEAIAHDALNAARAVFDSFPLHFRRSTSGISIGSKTVHRRRVRIYGSPRRRDGIPGEVCTCNLETGAGPDTANDRGAGERCPRHPYMPRRRRTETPEGGSGKAS